VNPFFKTSRRCLRPFGSFPFRFLRPALSNNKYSCIRTFVLHYCIFFFRRTQANCRRLGPSSPPPSFCKVLSQLRPFHLIDVPFFPKRSPPKTQRSPLARRDVGLTGGVGTAPAVIHVDSPSVPFARRISSCTNPLLIPPTRPPLPLSCVQAHFPETCLSFLWAVPLSSFLVFQSKGPVLPVFLARN